MKKFLDSILFVETRLRSIGGEQLIDRADQCAAWARQIAATSGVVDDARFDEIDAALGEFLSMARDADPQLTSLRRVTFRKAGGKAHRGIVHEGCERPSAVCGCPGASNGSLTQGAEIIAEGWEKANCCPNDRPRKRRVLKPLNAVKAPKEKGPIVPAAAKAEMRFARQCREAAANWANGHGYSKNEHEIHRNVEHFNNEASAHEQRAAQIIAEAEGVKSMEEEHAEKARLAAAVEADKRAELAAEEKANADFAAFAEEHAVYVVRPSSSVGWGVYNTERKCFVYSTHCEDAAKTEAARRNAAWVMQEDDAEDVYDSMSQEEIAGNNGFGGLI